MRDFVVMLLYVCFRVKPLWKVTCVNTAETVMEGRMHEHVFFVFQCFICHVSCGWVGGWVGGGGMLSFVVFSFVVL